MPMGNPGDAVRRNDLDDGRLDDGSLDDGNLVDTGTGVTAGGRIDVEKIAVIATVIAEEYRLEKL